jgi:hypothetical protein
VIHCKRSVSKRHDWLPSSTIYVLVIDNKVDFYKIIDIAIKKYKNSDTVLDNTKIKRIFTIYQLAHFFELYLAAMITFLDR